MIHRAAFITLAIGVLMLFHVRGSEHEDSVADPTAMARTTCPGECHGCQWYDGCCLNTGHVWCPGGGTNWCGAWPCVCAFSGDPADGCCNIGVDPCPDPYPSHNFY